MNIPFVCQIKFLPAFSFVLWWWILGRWAESAFNIKLIFTIPIPQIFIGAYYMLGSNLPRLSGLSLSCCAGERGKVKVKVVQLCPPLCDPVDYTVHGILQARILEWVAFPFSRGSSQPRDCTQVSCVAAGFFTILNYEGSPVREEM